MLVWLAHLEHLLSFMRFGSDVTWIAPFSNPLRKQQPHLCEAEKGILSGGIGIIEAALGPRDRKSVV